jgi:translocation and assembly module TamB
MDEDSAPLAVPARKRGWRRYALAAVLALLGLATLGVVLLDSPIGHRFVANRIASYTPQSGLRVQVGRIEGSLFNQAVLRDVALSDHEGVFARVPRAELDWRPLHWFSSGLDIRKLVLRRGTLLRRPHLRPGDPDAPILPAWDIRIDRLEIEDLTLASGIAGAERKIDLTGKIDIRKGRALVRVDGKLGGKDRLFALLDAEPDRDKFDLKLDIAAPAGGALAGLSGAAGDLRAIISGKGSWHRWQGDLLITQGQTWLAAAQLSNRAGHYRVLGLAWPGDRLTGLAARAVGKELAIDAKATFTRPLLEGRFALIGQGLRATGSGGIDLAENRFQALRVQAVPLRPDLLGTQLAITGGRIDATLDGPFRALTINHVLSAQTLAIAPATRIEGLIQRGTANFDGTRWTIPLDLAATRIVTGNPQLDPRLVHAAARGTLQVQGSRIWSDDLGLAVPGLGAQLALRGDSGTGAIGLAGPVAARGLALPDLGLADADARIVLSLGPNAPWRLRGDLTGRLVRADNATLTAVAGTDIRFAGRFALAQGQPLLLEAGTLTGSKLALGLAGRRFADGRTILIGKGRHAEYGRFDLDANLGAGGPRAVLVFAEPYPAAGLHNVRVALSPIRDGFRLETQGGSRFGPFTGVIGLFAQAGGPTRLAIERLTVSQTAVSGNLLLSNSRVAGTLAVQGGGVDGTVQLAPQGRGQGFVLALTAHNARFGGENPFTLANGHIEGGGLLEAGHTSFTGNATGEGLAQGQLFVGRFAASARINDGRGNFTASLAGRRGSRFNLQLTGEIAPQRIAVLAGGDLAGRRISMPRRAVLTAEGDGWRLAPAQVDFGGGRAIASGRFGGGETALDLALSGMPLSLADIYFDNLGFGGVASGHLQYRLPANGPPTGTAQLQVTGLTRSGLVLTSRPLDLALNASLTGSQLDLRATAADGGQVRGRVQGRISGLTAQGSLQDRLQSGQLFGQVRYDGPADALWRLVALEAFDLTGQVAMAADVDGSLANPRYRGSLASDGMRLRSALIGSDITGISVRGRFAGSRLDLTSFSGRAANGGQVSGSGSVDLAGLGERAPAIDLRIAARNAQILSRDDMAATVTGPLRIVSDGVQGTIAGRLAIASARWQLGRATAASALPNVRTREINLRADVAPPRALAAPWRFMIDASGPGGIAVAGLGIDSEWGADLRIRGTTEAPALGGHADLVQGGYEFAGRRFEMRRGRIVFDGSSPANPRLDILAEANVTGLSARVNVTGNSFAPQIAFSSSPALPEDELLSRLLFGTSITNISAPEAIQLAAALSSLRNGGGLDPINRLRAAIGLDRLRIVSADPTLGRGTGIAAGKYLGRRFYAEIISDGRGYSATQLEFRVSNWLAILASISTVGRESVNARISRDY